MIKAWIAAQTNLTTWSADFVQTRSLKALRQPLVSTGHVWFATPNRFRWELGVPARTIAVRDADRMQVVYPRLKRIEQYPLLGEKSGPLGEALALLDAGFPRGQEDFAARFHVRSLQATNGTWVFDLQPVSDAARRILPSIRVTVDESNYGLLAHELVFPDGSQIRSDFTHATLNEPIPEDWFTPTWDAEFKRVEPIGP